MAGHIAFVYADCIASNTTLYVACGCVLFFVLYFCISICFVLVFYGSVLLRQYSILFICAVNLSCYCGHNMYKKILTAFKKMLWFYEVEKFIAGFFS